MTDAESLSLTRPPSPNRGRNTSWDWIGYVSNVAIRTCSLEEEEIVDQRGGCAAMLCTDSTWPSAMGLGKVKLQQLTTKYEIRSTKRGVYQLMRR